MTLELFLEEIELVENTTDDNTFDIFYDNDTKLIHAIENNVEVPRKFIYRLKGEEDEIAREHRQEILEYCLAVVLPTDEVGLGDIFTHRKYIELVE
jgi:ribonuclease HIII